MQNTFILKFGEVVNIDDETGGGRIKVKIAQDKTDGEYAFPLLPKPIQVKPKVGEGVIVLSSELNNPDSNRFYIGPIISQPQYFEKDEYNYGRGTATTLLGKGSNQKILATIDKYDETKGAFPNNDDVAVIGRKSEDVILKDGEIDIRCGIRQKPNNSSEKDLKGNVVFNKVNPAYVQLKHNKTPITKGANTEANSIVNVVADKINFIGHKNIEGYNLTDNEELITKDDMQQIIQTLHQLPHGDKLVKLLELMIKVTLEHAHSFPGHSLIETNDVVDLKKFDLNSILSKDVRIS
jgi:hypothetical protein